MRIKILLFEQCKTKEDIQQLVKAGTDWIRTYPGERLHIQLAYLENLPETLIPDAREVVLFFNDLTETAENTYSFDCTKILAHCLTETVQTTVKALTADGKVQ